MSVKIQEWNGVWWLFLNHHGRRTATRVGPGPQAKKAAEVAAITRQARLLEGDLSVFDERPAHATLGIYAETWLATHAHQGCTFSTARVYVVNVRRPILPVLGAKPVHRLSRADCRALLAACRGKGLARDTIENICRTLSSLLSQAVEEGLLAANPAMRLGRYDRNADPPKRPICPLTQPEGRGVLAAAPQEAPREYPLLLCAARTDLRLGELLALQWEDLDFHGRFLEVQRHLVAGRLTTPKSGKPRRVDMSDQRSATRQGLRTARKEGTLRRGWGQVPEGVFGNEAGGRLDGDHFRKRVFYKVLEKAGLRRIRIHDLRHTFASLLLLKGENLKYIQEQLGHSSIQVTWDMYGPLIPGANRAAVDRLDDATSRNPDATSNEQGVTA